MKYIICLISIIYSTFGYSSVTNKIELMKSCSRCNRSGEITIYQDCPTCHGSGLTHRKSLTNLHGNLEVNSIRCTTCSLSAKLGKLKKRITCPECNGEKQVGTGRFKEVVQYTDKEQKEIFNKKNESLKDKNSKLIEKQKKIDRIMELKRLRYSYEKEWKRLTLEENTNENMEKKMHLRSLIKKYDEEIKNLTE